MNLSINQAVVYFYHALKRTQHFLIHPISSHNVQKELPEQDQKADAGQQSSRQDDLALRPHCRLGHRPLHPAHRRRQPCLRCQRC